MNTNWNHKNALYPLMFVYYLTLPVINHTPASEEYYIALYI